MPSERDQVGIAFVDDLLGAVPLKTAGGDDRAVEDAAELMRRHHRAGAEPRSLAGASGGSPGDEDDDLDEGEGARGRLK